MAATESGNRPRILFVGTYPPTQCGIAFYTRSLIGALNDMGATWQAAVVRLTTPEDRSTVGHDNDVVAEVSPQDASWARETAATCRQGDIVWIQHEYGIFGPEDGIGVTELAQDAPVPVIVTLHTVPANPTPRQRRVLEDLAGTVRYLVVMSLQARRRLLSLIDVDPARVRVIPHGGVHTTPSARRGPGNDRPTIVNWGLIGPGKGLEWAIRAMPMLRGHDPLPRLLIRGATHPNVRRRDGEAYRRSLENLVTELEVGDMVDIDNGYLSSRDLIELMELADLALLPYDSTEQVTSGVLIDAIGAGIPVIAAEFPHAVEMLWTGAGTLVPHRDPVAIANASRRFITDPEAAQQARQEARRLVRRLAWPKVAAEHHSLALHAITCEAAGVP